MRRWLQIVFPPNASVASIPLVFFSVSIVSVLQFPVYFLIREGWISAGVVANEILAIAALPIFLIYFLKLDRSRLLPLSNPGFVVIAGVIVVTLGAVIIMDYLTFASEQFFPLPGYVEKAFEKLMASSGKVEVIWKLFIICGLTAVCEEIFFRGFCQTSLTAHWGNKVAIVVTALIFAGLHGNPWYMHLYFLLGLFFGWVYAASGSLWAVILCHFINNAWVFLNHIRGFKLPLNTPPNLNDVLIIIVGVVLFVVGVILLRPRKMALRGGEGQVI